MDGALGLAKLNYKGVRGGFKDQNLTKMMENDENFQNFNENCRKNLTGSGNHDLRTSTRMEFSDRHIS